MFHRPLDSSEAGAALDDGPGWMAHVARITRKRLLPRGIDQSHLSRLWNLCRQPSLRWGGGMTRGKPMIGVSRLTTVLTTFLRGHLR
jgi:hypothetical protein